jgi:hypothetical protein
VPVDSDFYDSVITDDRIPAAGPGAARPGIRRVRQQSRGIPSRLWYITGPVQSDPGPGPVTNDTVTAAVGRRAVGGAAAAGGMCPLLVHP